MTYVDEFHKSLIKNDTSDTSEQFKFECKSIIESINCCGLKKY